MSMFCLIGLLTFCRAFCDLILFLVLKMESVHLLTVFYLLFSFCIVFPIPVFVSCGLTVEGIFSKWLGAEHKSFIEYQLRRIVATIIAHASLPLGYVLLRIYVDPELKIGDSVLWQSFLLGSLTITIGAVSQMYLWYRDNWKMHPVMSKLRTFCGDHAIQDIINDIDNDFVKPDKVIISCNPTSKVVGTQKWLIKTSSYDLDIALQSDVDLQVLSSDEHDHPIGNQASLQFLKINVTSSRPNVPSFNIRINSASLKDLQNIITQPIKIMNNIQVKSTILDHFLVAFKEQVKMNPTVTIPSHDEQCYACYEKRPNVKLMKTCGDASESNRCVSCLCKSLWCVDCIGTWFAIRQDQDTPHQWMSSKGTCPMCRCTFCVLDVCNIIEDHSQ